MTKYVKQQGQEEIYKALADELTSDHANQFRSLSRSVDLEDWKLEAIKLKERQDNDPRWDTLIDILAEVE